MILRFSKIAFGLLIALIMCSCNNKSDFKNKFDTKEIHYIIENSLVNQLIIDSILRDDYAEVNYCKMDYYFDTTNLTFFYKDDDYSPWTNEMIARTNRFLVVGNHKIPMIFESDFTFVIENSVMNGKAIRKSYNWMNFAEIELFQNRELIKYKNNYADGGRKISEEGREKYK